MFCCQCKSTGNSAECFFKSNTIHESDLQIVQLNKDSEIDRTNETNATHR